MYKTEEFLVLTLGFGFEYFKHAIFKIQQSMHSW